MSDIKNEDVIEAYNGLVGNWDIEAIISEIKNSWDREAMADLFRISAHLINTIESQKEEIERLLALIAEKEDRGTDYFDQAITELSPEKIDYKAISELAVRGLKDIKISQLVTPSKTLTIVRDTLSKIEELQNGTT